MISKQEIITRMRKSESKGRVMMALPFLMPANWDESAVQFGGKNYLGLRWEVTTTGKVPSVLLYFVMILFGARIFFLSFLSFISRPFLS